MNQRFVYFDLGNVLVNFDHQYAVNNLAQLANCSADQARTAAFESGLQDQYETGLIDSAEYVKNVNENLKVTLGQNDVLEAISAIFEVNASIRAALELVKTRGVPMGILSNTCQAHWEWISKQNWSIPGEWFTEHVLSYEVKSMKPDSKIYEICEEKAQCNPNRIFFTDDRQENIAAAKARNWRTHLFRETRDLLPALEQWLAED